MYEGKELKITKEEQEKCSKIINFYVTVVGGFGKKNRFTSKSIRTGIKDIDYHLGGVHCGETYLILSEPYIGKKTMVVMDIKMQEERISRLLDLYMDNAISKEEYMEKRVKEEAQLDIYKERLSEVDDLLPTHEHVNVEERIETLLKNMKEKLDFDSYSIPDCIIDEFVDRIIFDKDKFYRYLNVASKDAKKRYKNAAKEICEDRTYVNSICTDDSEFDTKNYVYFTSFVVTRDDINRLMAHREEFKKANRFKEFEVFLFI